jgi:MFS transporter, DHA2 family, multidrug resistance protein
LFLMPIAGLVMPFMQPKYWIALGLAGIALAMWQSTGIVPNSTFGYFALIRVYQMIGLPFLFIPINTVAYERLPPDKTNQGSALINVSRNLGGSIGVSLANVELLQRSQFHQARLVSNLYPSSPVLQSTIKEITHFFAHRGAPPTTASAHAFGYIAQIVERQASLMAYIDVFHTWAIAAAALIPVVLLLIKRVSTPASAMH